MGNGDYIKLNRKILEWEWYKDEHTKNLFLHCLLKANWKEGKFKGTTVPRGSFISSVQKLSEETNLSVQQIKTALKHLKSTGEVTSKATNKFTVFTIKNYGIYQDINQQDNQQVTSNQQTNNQQVTTIEERKKERREEGKKINDLIVSKDTICSADVERIIEGWNSLDLDRIIKITEGTQRCKLLKRRIKDYGVETVLEAVEKVRQSNFLHGNNSKGWQITFDWFIRPNNFPKVIGGNYDNRSSTGSREDIIQMFENVGKIYRENDYDV